MIKWLEGMTKWKVALLIHKNKHIRLFDFHAGLQPSDKVAQHVLSGLALLFLTAWTCKKKSKQGE